MSDIENHGIKKKVFLSMNNIDGNPDGMAVDKNGNLWVAMWEVEKYVVLMLRVILN